VHLADASAARAIDTRPMSVAAPAHRPPSLPRRKHASERALVAAAQARTPGSREALVEAFFPLIGSVSRIYRGSAGVDRSELMQAGVLGLLRALNRYDPDLGTPFWAYASWWVREAMQELVSELELPVVLSDRALRQLARVRDARREHVQRHGREPSRAELAAAAGIARDQVERLVVAERKPRGLEEAVGGDWDAGTRLSDVLADPTAEDAYDRVPVHAETPQLSALLDELDARERWIVVQRFGLDGHERTLRELANVLGVSAERVRQVEQVALDKLRAALLGNDVARNGHAVGKAGKARQGGSSAQRVRVSGSRPANATAALRGQQHLPPSSRTASAPCASSSGAPAG
jgi:RNA polymerase primary sigma factor